MESVIGIISVLKTSLYYSLFLSCKIGQFLVFVLKGIAGYSLEAIEAAATVIRIVLEDFTYFINDVSSAVFLFISVVYNNIMYMLNFLSSFGMGIYINLQAIFLITTGSVSSLIEILRGILVNIKMLATFIKRFIILFGSGVWFAITFIPLCVMYFCTIITYYIRILIQEIQDMITQVLSNMCQMVLEVFYFIVDVPLESTIGLIAAASIIYMLIEFHRVLINYTVENVNFMYEVVCRYYQNFKRRLIDFSRRSYYAIKNIRIYRRRSTQDEVEADFVMAEDSGRFCVACQERLKCILTLPCRHVCLCYECMKKIRESNNACPLCRTKVNRTMKIFV